MAGTSVDTTKTGTVVAAGQSIVDVVGEKVNAWLTQGQIRLPKSYSVDNAMKFAYLELQNIQNKDYKPLFVNGKLDENVATKESLINALLSMAVQGLNVGKDQGYFIVYGKTVSFQRSYFGTECVTMMVEPKVKDFSVEIIYEGDEFEYEIKAGKKFITTHKQSFGNMKTDKILGAYAIALDEQGSVWKTDLMTIAEIHQSWKQSKANPFGQDGKVKPDSNHGKFPVEYCKKTVLGRLCKPIINTSTDNQLLLDMIRKTDDLADRAEAESEIETEANTGPVIDITPEPAAVAETATGGEPVKGEDATVPADEPGPISFGSRIAAAATFNDLNEIMKDIKADPSLEKGEQAALGEAYLARAKQLKQAEGAERKPGF